MNLKMTRKRLGITVIMLTLIFLVFFPSQVVAQLAAGKSKFLGNIIQSSVPANYSAYWNQVTPENAGKWGSVESTRDVYNWTDCDTAYNYAKNNGYKFRFHTFVWGSQYPSWITSLSAADQKAEVEEWIQLACQRYPNMDFIDVVNEPLHAPPPFSAALGGSGTTGWDWVIWSFETARKYTSAQLCINDYNIIYQDSGTTNYLTIINLLISRGLLDGIGEQAHSYESVSVTTLQNNLNRLGQTGKPVYITEWEAQGDDATQLAIYQAQFPMYWESSYVAGITLWGYINGTMWRNSGYLVTSADISTTERPALQWIRTYLQGSTTAVPTAVATAAPTDVATAAPTTPPTVTAAPTDTPAPTSIPTATPVGVTADPTAAPGDTVAPTTPPTVTDPPATGCTCTNLCSSQTAISVPFTKDGAGEFCYTSSSLASYVNSWNCDAVNINGTSCTNTYISSSSIAAISGVYYIYYKGSYAWSHLEIK